MTINAAIKENNMLLLTRNWPIVFHATEQSKPIGLRKFISCKSDVWLTVHRNSVWIRKTN